MDIARCYREVKRVVLTASNLKQGMDDLIDFCQKDSPNPELDKIRKLDFEHERKKLENWLGKNLNSEPPSDEIKAFWFGIFENADRNRPAWVLYFYGLTAYDPEDESGDWACCDDTAYLPKDRYADSNILKEVYQVVHSKGYDETGGYVLPLGYAGLVVKFICNSIKGSLLGGQNGRGVAVGFDEGDFLIIGEFGKK